MLNLNLKSVTKVGARGLAWAKFKEIRENLHLQSL